MTLRQTLKKASNFAYMETWSLRSSSVALVDTRTDSASSPKQYSSVLTCLSSESVERPDATRNCSYRLHHRGQSSGDLKLKGLGGVSCIPAISILEFDHCCHHVVLSYRLTTPLNDSAHNCTYSNQCIHNIGDTGKAYDIPNDEYTHATNCNA